MLSLRDVLLPVVHEARGLVGDLGMHQPTVLLRTRTYASGKLETGPSTVSDLILGAPSLDMPGQIVPPHVKGAPSDPVIDVGPITPYHPITAPSGFPLTLANAIGMAQVNPGDAAGVEYYFVVAWPNGPQKRYQLAPRGLNAARPMRIMLKLAFIDLDFAF